VVVVVFCHCHCLCRPLKWKCHFLITQECMEWDSAIVVFGYVLCAMSVMSTDSIGSSPWPINIRLRLTDAYRRHSPLMFAVWKPHRTIRTRGRSSLASSVWNFCWSRTSILCGFCQSARASTIRTKSKEWSRSQKWMQQLTNREAIYRWWRLISIFWRNHPDIFFGGNDPIWLGRIYFSDGLVESWLVNLPPCKVPAWEITS